MKKSLIVFLILALILFTAFIKNSTKRIDDEIFAIKENIRVLNKEISNSRLEYTYLSSGNRLMSFKAKFFNQDFDFKKKDKIKTFTIDNEKIFIKN